MYNPGPWQTKPIHQRIRNLDGEEEGDRSTLSLFLKGLVKQIGHFIFPGWDFWENVFEFAIFTLNIMKGVDCMKMYNVKEISELLSVNEETVRRWIRSGELKASQSSKKQGNVVNEYDLLVFVSDKPKYKKMIGGEQNTTNPLVDLLDHLINQRNLLDKCITKIQSLLEEP